MPRPDAARHGLVDGRVTSFLTPAADIACPGLVGIPPGLNQITRPRIIVRPFASARITGSLAFTLPINL